MSVFVDANVLVCARDSSEPAKQPTAAAWVERLWSTGDGRLSRQVLNELYVSFVYKLNPGMPPRDARAEVRDLMAWRPLPLDRGLITAVWDLQEIATRFRFGML